MRKNDQLASCNMLADMNPSMRCTNFGTSARPAARRERDSGIHVRKNGDMYLVHPGDRPRRTTPREAQG